MKSSYKNKPIIKQILHQIRTFKIKQRKIMQYHLDETGVYHSQHRLLMEISRNKDASQKELANLMGISTATIAVSLKKLQKGGYISKVIDKDDNRLNKIAITDKGNRVVEKSEQICDSIDQKIFKGFTKEELNTLFKLFQKLNLNLNMIENEINSKK